MFCCCLKRHGEEEDGQTMILDVEKVLKDHVWTSFTDKLSKLQRACLRRDDFNVVVPMNFFLFETIDQRVKPRCRPETGKDGHILDKKYRDEKDLSGSKFGPVRKKNEKRVDTESNTVEIATDFLNATDTEQTYKFRLEKTRKAALNITFQRGFSIGGKASFTIGLPKVLSNTKASAETDVRVTVTKTDGELVEETVVLETTSDIKVEKRSKYVAKVVMSETRVSYDFRVWSRMSMPTGGAPVSVVRKKDNKVYFSSILKRLDVIFDKYKGQVTIEEASGGGDTANYTIIIKTTGIIDGVRLSDQRIVLESNALTPPKKVQEPEGEDEEKEKVMINVDYVPQQATIYPYTSSVQRSRSIDGPIIEEASEGEEEDEGIGNGGRTPSRPPSTRVPLSIDVIPSIVTTAPSSVGSSPMSEKEISDASDASKTITTV